MFVYINANVFTVVYYPIQFVQVVTSDAIVFNYCLLHDLIRMMSSVITILDIIVFINCSLYIFKNQLYSPVTTYLNHMVPRSYFSPTLFATVV